MRRRMGFLSSLFVQGIRTIVPLLFGVILFVAKLMLTAVISLIVGIPEATDRIAKEQEQIVMKNGRLPTIYARHYYWIVRILAGLVVLFGWICFSFTTVYLVTIIF